MFDLLDEEQDVRDVPNAPDLEVTSGEVVFENVSFSYDDDRQVLHDISFSCRGGEVVALVG